MKKIALITTAALASTSAFAGSITYVAPDMTEIEPVTRMGGSGAWLIPLIIAAVVLLAVTKSNGSNNDA